ncbi:hypothetical protein BIW11_00997, partial [Tropilaelaps mercedesae]
EKRPSSGAVLAERLDVEQIISKCEFTTWDSFVELAARVVYLTKKLKGDPEFREVNPPEDSSPDKYYDLLVREKRSRV